jgi:hypothetical protein
MRTNDAPGERQGLADAGATRRRPAGGAGDLRQRLESLRAGHPSSPEYGDGDGESAAAGDEGTGADREAAEGAPGGLPGREGTRPHGAPGGRGHASPGHAELGRPGPLGGSQPYRPWFSSGESLEPWFTGDPGDPPG